MTPRTTDLNVTQGPWILSLPERPPGGRSLVLIVIGCADWTSGLVCGYTSLSCECFATQFGWQMSSDYTSHEANVREFGRTEQCVHIGAVETAVVEGKLRLTQAHYCNAVLCVTGSG